MRNTTFALVVGVLIAVIVAPAAAQEDAGTQVVIKFDKDMNLREFLDVIALSTKTALIYDPNAQRIRNQKMGSTVEIRVPTARLLDTFRALLSFYELTLIPVGPASAKIYLVIDSRSTNNFVKNKAKFVAPEDVPGLADRDGMYIATLFPLQHVRNMTMVRTAISTMVTPAGIGRVVEIPEVGIIVMDFAPTVAGIQNLLRRADVPSDNTMEMASIELAHSKADEVAAAVQSMFPAPPPATPRRGFSSTSNTRPVITPFPHRNAIIVRATRKHMAEIRALVVNLDNTAVNRKRIEVVRLQEGNPRDVANTIMDALYGHKKIAKTVTIVGDRSTNAVVVSGSETEVKLVLALIKRLDTATPAK